MRRKIMPQILAASIIAALAAAPAATNAQGQPASRPAEAAPSAPAQKDQPDLLRGPVEPFEMGPQRIKFLKAAGVDNELDEEEFAADARRDDGFVQKFDRWAAIKAHDKNNNSKIDWFEARDYREDIRKKLLAACDENKDGRLLGTERGEAQKLLLSGRLDRPRGGRGNAGIPEELVKKHDADGDGKLTGQERVAAFREWGEQRRREMEAPFDTDGDGQLSDEERAAMRDKMREDAQQRREEWIAEHDTDGDGELSRAERQAMRRENDPMFRALSGRFDADGDGVLSEEEEARMKALQQRFNGFGQEMGKQMMGITEDREMTPEEQQALGRRMRLAGMTMMSRFAAIADTDGDGQVSGEERQAATRQIQRGMQRYVEKLATRHDADEDGLLSDDECDALVTSTRTYMRERIAGGDTNEDGEIDAQEAAAVLIRMSQDMGLLPADEQEQE
jgi:Ca2+-binding EF-hand superfamily protein